MQQACLPLGLRSTSWRQIAVLVLARVVGSAYVECCGCCLSQRSHVEVDSLVQRAVAVVARQGVQEGTTFMAQRAARCSIRGLLAVFAGTVVDIQGCHESAGGPDALSCRACNYGRRPEASLYADHTPIAGH
jgi:hypothetical protein